MSFSLIKVFLLTRVSEFIGEQNNGTFLAYTVLTFSGSTVLGKLKMHSLTQAKVVTNLILHSDDSSLLYSFRT